MSAGLCGSEMLSGNQWQKNRGSFKRVFKETVLKTGVEEPQRIGQSPRTSNSETVATLSRTDQRKNGTPDSALPDTGMSHEENFILGGAVRTGQSSASPREVFRKGTLQHILLSYPSPPS